MEDYDFEDDRSDCMPAGWWLIPGVLLGFAVGVSFMVWVLT